MMSYRRRSRILSIRGLFRGWLERGIVKVFFKRIGEHFFLLLGGPVFFQTLRTACQLNLFGLLSSKPGLTKQEIASHLGIAEYPTLILLMSCVALKFLKKSGERYRCSRLLASRLDKNSPRSMVPILEWMHHIVYPSMFYYLELMIQSRAVGLEIFKGEEDNLYARLTHDPKLEKIFHEAMQTNSQATNTLFVEMIKFSNFSRILDVGGGNGENIIRIVKRYPNVSGTVLDFSTVAEMAMKKFKDEGLDHRLKAIGANFLEEDFPRGHDCILFCHLTSVVPEETNRQLMRRAYEALEPGGVACIYAPFMDNDEGGPLLSALLSPYFLCTVNGKSRNYSWRETASWLEDAGFVKIIKARLIRNEGVILGFKP